MTYLMFLRVLLVAMAASNAFAVDVPARKPGLWEIRTTVNGRPTSGGPIRQCVDAKTDDPMGQGASTGASCSRNDVTRSGDRILIRSTCDFGATKTTTEGVFTGSFDSAYRAELKTTYSPPLMGMSEANTVIDAKWIGACQAGQKPGDIVRVERSTAVTGGRS